MHLRGYLRGYLLSSWRSDELSALNKRENPTKFKAIAKQITVTNDKMQALSPKKTNDTKPPYQRRSL
jgi:hypothetical protein